MESDAFYVVRKGDVIGVYRSFSECHGQLSSSVCDPAVSVYKGYSLHKEAEEYLASHGLKNAIYSINSVDVKEDLFGTLVPCFFQMENEHGNRNVTITAVKKGKGKKRTGTGKIKAVWDADRHATFIRLCLKQVKMGNKPHQTLNKVGYLNLEKEFYEETGRHYQRDQFKNHWDNTRREWQMWDALRKETCMGWNDKKNTYSQSPEWWAGFAKQFPGGDKFADHPLEHADDLDILFGGGAAMGDIVNIPSFGAISVPEDGTGGSHFEPTLESAADVNEVEPVTPTVGTPFALPSGVAGLEEFVETSGPQRSNPQTSVTRSEKHPKMICGHKRDQNMKQVCDLLNKRTKFSAPPRNEDPSSMPSAIALLNEAHGIVKNSDEWFFAASMFRNEANRQLFVTLGDQETRAIWIKREYALADRVD